MAKRGRPIALDEVNKSTFLALTTFGLKLDEAAHRTGVAPITVRRALNLDEKFRTDYRNARFRSVAKVLDTLHAAARENWKAATWYAERMLPEHFAKRSPRHITLDTANSMFREALREIRAVLPRGPSRRLAMRRLSRLAILWDRDLRPGGARWRPKRRRSSLSSTQSAHPAAAESSSVSDQRKHTPVVGDTAFLAELPKDEASENAKTCDQN